MNLPLSPGRCPRARSLLFLREPQRWPAWPFLPLTKSRPGQPMEYGVMFDAMGTCGLPGFSATVFLTNVFLLPRQLDEFLALPREMFDTREEVADAGWCVD
jgi:hypothetical protein